MPEPARLVSYTDCHQMVGQLQQQALEAVGPYGLTGPAGVVRNEAAVPGGVVAVPTMAAPAAVGGAESAGTSASASAGATTGSPGAGAPTFSMTNDQEQGVDEPDLAKTDGSLLVTLRRQSDTLQVADVGPSPQLGGALALTPLVQATGLLLVGHDAVVLGQAVTSPAPSPSASLTPGGPAAAQSTPPVGAPAIVVGPSGTEVVVVDLSDPAHPQVARSFSVQGDLVDARLIAGTVEVVVRSTPRLPFVSPTDGSTTAIAAATAANRSVVLSSGPSSWLPSVTSEPSGTTTVAPCSSAMHATGATATSSADPASPSEPPSPGGPATIGIVPIDPSSDQPGTEVTVVGDATTVYASATSLYVATSLAPAPAVAPGAPLPTTGASSGGAPGTDQVAPDSTVIDAFDLSDPSAPRYVGSGQVPGTLIGQYALSEYEGHLRVATTVGSATPPPGEGTAPTTPSDSRVTVLSIENGALVPMGSVSGMGSGEKIYAVRFVGPLAYVVTFRQTDPLYVVDLSDPAAPRLAGQLPLTGYSSFLQPLGNNLILGVGQGVDDNLRTSGLQVSLFDVSDPANPKLLSKDVLTGAYSSAEQDPHALLFWAPTGTVVLPVMQPLPGPVPVDGGPVPVEGGAVEGGAVDSPASEFSGAVVWRLGGSSLAQAGRITQPAAQIERTLVVGDKLYTVSEGGILQSDLATLAQGAWLAYS